MEKRAFKRTVSFSFDLPDSIIWNGLIFTICLETRVDPGFFPFFHNHLLSPPDP